MMTRALLETSFYPYPLSYLLAEEVRSDAWFCTLMDRKATKDATAGDARQLQGIINQIIENNNDLTARYGIPKQ